MDSEPANHPDRTTDQRAARGDRDRTERAEPADRTEAVARLMTAGTSVAGIAGGGGIPFAWRNRPVMLRVPRAPGATFRTPAGDAP